MNGDALLAIAGEVGTPTYVYHQQTLIEQARKLKGTFDRYSLYYSVKANPHPRVCETLAGMGFEAEVVTEGEIRAALRGGFNASAMLFAGPAKTASQISFALDSGVRLMTAESIGQLDLIDRIAKGRGCQVSVLLRINDPELYYAQCESMVGNQSQFGSDVESLVAAQRQIAAMSNVSLVGTQYYAGSQILNPERLPRSAALQIKLTRRLAEVLPITLKAMDIGGGFGIPYGPHESEFDLEICARLLEQQIDSELTSEVRVLIESGRYLTGPAGVFLTRIIDVKVTGGTCYAICDGGMSGFTRPVLVRSPHRARLLRDGASLAVDSERNCVLCGPSCASIDKLGEFSMPQPRPGDLIAVSDAGAYGYSMSIHSFHCLEAPQEVFIPE